MEWMVPVNEMLVEEVTKLNHTLIPPGFRGDVRSVRLVQESLSKVIDQLGEQSAAAQGLNKVITNAEKLRKALTHTLYLLKDANGKGGKGEVIGMLKVGPKHLFLWDSAERVREVEPLCVLDFYVLGDRQRRGNGRALFDHMLRDMSAEPHLLAIDGPSPKMEHFLYKNYQIGPLIKQSNNFAISPRFFDSAPNSISKSSCTTPATPTVGRFAAPKPHSAIATVIHGGASGEVISHPNGECPRAEESAAPEVMADSPAAELEEVAEEVVEEEQHASRERPRTLPVSAAPPPAPAEPSPAGSTLSRRDSQLTDKGFFDVKFYHNKLW